MMRVLVVDDSKTMLEYVKVTLRDLGVKDILVAQSGQEALNIFREFQEGINMIFTDWNMPCMSGIEFVKEIRKLDFTNQKYITMITAECDKSKVIEALEAGADNYVVKPFSKNRLLSIFRDFDRFQSKLEKLAV